jgi:hypothetical protein
MSTASVSETRRVNGNGNGHVEVAEVVGVMPPPRPAVSVSRGRIGLDPYQKPYSCIICGLRLDETDTARLDQIIASYGKVVRVICSSHTGRMNNLEFRLLQHPVATKTV